MFDKAGQFQDGHVEHNSEYTSQSKFSIFFYCVQVNMKDYNIH